MTPGTPLKNPIPSKSGDPWADWYRRLEKFDGDFCGVAKDEIDKVLVLVRSEVLILQVPLMNHSQGWFILCRIDCLCH